MSEKTEKTRRAADRRQGDRRKAKPKAFRGEDRRTTPRREKSDRRRA